MFCFTRQTDVGQMHLRGRPHGQFQSSVIVLGLMLAIGQEIDYPTVRLSRTGKLAILAASVEWCDSIRGFIRQTKGRVGIYDVTVYNFTVTWLGSHVMVGHVVWLNNRSSVMMAWWPGIKHLAATVTVWALTVFTLQFWFNSSIFLNTLAFISLFIL